MDKWEYTTVELYRDGHSDLWNADASIIPLSMSGLSLPKMLNYMGSRGWESAGFISYNHRSYITAVFKRKIQK